MTSCLFHPAFIWKRVESGSGFSMERQIRPSRSFPDTVEVSLEVVATICALLPAGSIVAAFLSLYPQGWLKFPAVWGILAILLLLSELWWRVATKTRRRSMLAGIFAVAACVVSFRTDWIVMTRYSYMGNLSMNSYVPPRSPLWRPPTPGQLVPGATSWNNYRFFYGGGAGGPAGEPWLEVNWVGVTFRLAAFTIAPFIVISGILKLVERSQKRRTQAN